MRDYMQRIRFRSGNTVFDYIGVSPTPNQAVYVSYIFSRVTRGCMITPELLESCGIEKLFAVHNSKPNQGIIKTAWEWLKS